MAGSALDGPGLVLDGTDDGTDDDAGGDAW